MRDNCAVNIRPEAQASSPPNRLFEGGAPIVADHHEQESSAPGAARPVIEERRTGKKGL